MKIVLPVLKRLFFILFIVGGFSQLANAQTLKGSITDAKTGETLVGATVQIENGSFKQSTVVKLDGTYIFKNVPLGSYKLKVNYIGYKTTKEYTVEVLNNKLAILNIAMVDDATALNEVSVIEHASTETDRSARSDEKNSNNTLNVVSAHSIAISPDVLVSNVLSRVSGISVDRGNTGEAQHAIIRGMDKQYNTVLINDVKIPSPDNKNRYVPLDIFPAELVEKIEVFKTLTPDMEADASGGVINMVMKTAPDNLRIEGYLGTGYSQLFLDRGFSSFNNSTVASKSPGGEIPPYKNASISDFPYQNLVTKTGNAPPNADVSLTIGDRFLNKKLGLVFSGTYRNDYAGNNTFQVVQGNTVGPAPVGSTQNSETNFQDAYLRQYSSQLSRLGTMASVDYQIDKNNSINLFGTYLQLNEYRVRQTEDLVYGGYSYLGYHYTYSIGNLTETRSDLQNIYNATLKGKHKLNDTFSLDWTLANSEATHRLPDIAEFQTSYNTSPDYATGHNEPTPGSPGNSTFVTPDIIKGPVYVGSESRTWNHNTDKDFSGYLNLHADTKIFGRKALFSVGGMFRHKTRDNFVDGYSLPHSYDPGSIYEVYVSVPASTFDFGRSPGNAIGTAATSAGVYTFEENVQGAYAMVKVLVNKRLDITAGLRAENTNQSWVSNAPPLIDTGATGSKSYFDYLPSINIKYAISDIQAIRASYFESLLRPAFADLIPYADGTQETYDVLGNYKLNHTNIHNFDLRYETFPGVFDEFLVGVFYKYLISPIEQQFVHELGSQIALEPVNLGNAHNFGFEFSGKKFFGDVGVAANYTFTNSSITSYKSLTIQGQNAIYVAQTRPLQGQATNLGNVSLLYKNTKNGIDAQLALSYKGETIQAVSPFYNLDTWEKASTNLDFSAQKSLGGRFVVFVKVNNILNTPYELYIKQDNTYNYTGIMKYPYQESPKHTTVEYDQYFARYNLGLRFKL